MAYSKIDSISFTRDSTQDIILSSPIPVLPEHNLYAWYDSTATPQRDYTLSTTLYTGMELYDNTGTSIGKTVGTINQDGSFDIQTTSTLSWVMECSSQAALTADCIRITVNGTEYGSELYTENSLVFNIGDTISWSYDADGGNVPYVTESSNTSLIALGYDAYDNTLSFTMPGENITFKLYTNWSGPV